MIRLLIAVLLFASFNALADVTLTELNNNTPADAEDVMGNFNALNAAIPLVWSDTDDDLEGTTIQDTFMMVSVNELQLTVVSQGVLVVSGSVYVSNTDGVGGYFLVDVLIDGESVSPDQDAQSWVTAVSLPGSDSSNSNYWDRSTTIAYTITVPVSAGVHNVVQKLGQSAQTSANFLDVAYFYNKNYLTAQYYPESQASLSGSLNARVGEATVNSFGE